MNTLPVPHPPALAPLAGPLPATGRELLSSITLQAPLLDVGSAGLALRCSQRHLMQWILGGDLEWAFDLRRAGARRCCLRILTESIIRLQQRQHPLTPRERAAQRLHLFQKVFDPMFPQHKPFLFSTELARVWACGTTHIHNLAEDGLLGLVDRDHVPRAAVQISRETAFLFMQSRRII